MLFPEVKTNWNQKLNIAEVTIEEKELNYEKTQETENRDWEVAENNWKTIWIIWNGNEWSIIISKETMKNKDNDNDKITWIIMRIEIL